jgi:sec-independent protein translocase protein TatB
MFDVGFLELVVIMVLALLVLGPERLPKAAQSVGYWFGKARRYVEGMKAQVEAEFDSTEVKRLLHNQEVQIRELQSKLNPIDDIANVDLQNQFIDDDDPGTGHIEAAPDEEAEKPASPQYEMIEEDDERWDSLEESKPSLDAVSEDPVEEKNTLDKAQ